MAATAPHSLACMLSSTLVALAMGAHLSGGWACRGQRGVCSQAGQGSACGAAKTVGKGRSPSSDAGAPARAARACGRGRGRSEPGVAGAHAHAAGAPSSVCACSCGARPGVRACAETAAAAAAASCKARRCPRARALKRGCRRGCRWSCRWSCRCVGDAPDVVVGGELLPLIKRHLADDALHQRVELGEAREDDLHLGLGRRGEPC